MKLQNGRFDHVDNMASGPPSMFLHWVSLRLHGNMAGYLVATFFSEQVTVLLFLSFCLTKDRLKKKKKYIADTEIAMTINPAGPYSPLLSSHKSP